MNKWLYLVLGGSAGTLSRYALAGFVQQVAGPRFPLGTLVVNLTGCFLIGFFDALSESKYALSREARLLLMAGFCGAFTTFSTWMFETGQLLKTGENTMAFLNIAGSVALGFLIFKFGMVLGKAV